MFPLSIYISFIVKKIFFPVFGSKKRRLLQSNLAGFSHQPSTPVINHQPSTPEQIPGTFPVGRRAVHPVDDTRFDGMDHWPQWTTKRVTCKLCAQNKKKALTMCICSKCNIALCCITTKNCFVEYHTKK